MGVDFFRRRSSSRGSTGARPDRSHHTIQTNGTLLNDEWCEFLAEHDFLVGISIDGPRRVHDAYRVDKRGRPTFDRVMRGVRPAPRATASSERPVHRPRREPGPPARGLPLLPRRPRRARSSSSSRSSSGDRRHRVPGGRRLSPDTLGRTPRRAGVGFLVAVFDEWVRRDVGTVFVQMFDAALASWSATPPALLHLRRDLRRRRRARAQRRPLLLRPLRRARRTSSATSPRRTWSSCSRRPSSERSATPSATRLPRYCRECDVRFACNGECPKNRFTVTPDGEPGLNYLCAGYMLLQPHRRADARSWRTCCARGRVRRRGHGASELTYRSPTFFISRTAPAASSLTNESTFDGLVVLRCPQLVLFEAVHERFDGHDGVGADVGSRAPGAAPPVSV